MPDKPEARILRITEPGKPTEYHIFRWDQTLWKEVHNRAHRFYLHQRNLAIETSDIERVQHCHNRLQQLNRLSYMNPEENALVLEWLVEEGFIIPPVIEAYFH